MSEQALLTGLHTDEEIKKWQAERIENQAQLTLEFTNNQSSQEEQNSATTTAQSPTALIATTES